MKITIEDVKECKFFHLRLKPIRRDNNLIVGYLAFKRNGIFNSLTFYRRFWI